MPSRCQFFVKFLRSVMYLLINSIVEPSRILQNVIKILEKLDGHLNNNSILLSMSQKKKRHLWLMKLPALH